MIKILFITSTLEKCGPNNQLYGLIKELDKNQFEVEVLTLSEEKDNSMISKYLDSGIKVERLRLSRLKFQILGKYFLKSYIQKKSPDIIHTQGVRADDKVSKLTEYQDIHCMTLRNYIYEDYEDKYGKYKGKLYNNLHYKAIKTSQYAICCSKSIAKKYEKLFHRDFLYVQNGVDKDTYFVPDCLKQNLKLKFVAIGSLILRKDPLTIISAFKKSGIEGNADLYILGDGKLRRACEKEINAGITLCGEINNVVPYLQSANYFISAASSEGLPNAVLEAGMCGCKLILSDIPQHREIAEKLPYWAVDFFELENIEQLSCILREKEKEICTEKQKREIGSIFAEKFSSLKMSQNYQTIYSKMLEAKRNEKK